MRVGLVTADFAPNVGGVAAHVVELGRALAELGHEVHVVTPNRHQLPEVDVWHGMTVHRPRLARAKPLFTFQLHRWLRAFCARQALDVLHVHGLRPLEATRDLGINIIFTNHTSGFLQRLERGAKARKRVAARLSHVHHVLAPSEELADATRAVGYCGPVDFIPNGVDISRFSPGSGANARQRLGLPGSAIVVLLARRLVPKNGCRFFAQSATHFTRPDVRLLIAGDGSERAEMERKLRDAGAFERTLFLGNVDNVDMPEIYRAASISVLPSLQEATSITGLESMATGLPLVGTRVGGIPAIIEHEGTGLLVPPQDARALGGAIRSLVDAPEQRAFLGENARQRAAAQFAWARIAADTAEVYACAP